MPKYIAQKRKLYTSRCNQENGIDAVTTKKYKHIVGLYEREQSKCPNVRNLKCSRSQNVEKSWELAPNRYGVLAEPYFSRKGAGGAYWARQHKAKPSAPLGSRGLQDSGKIQWKFYELGCGTKLSCQGHKGSFVSNARDRRPTARCMVNSLTGYRDPSEPGPTAYYPMSHTMASNVSLPDKNSKRPNPHIFLRQSCVPAKPNVIHAKNISFRPGPGRYENRFRNLCTCSPQLKHTPGLQLLIDREKRRKFRRMPYIKIKAHRHCSPDWRHVAGQGHRRLFRIPKKNDANVKAFKETKKSEKQYQLFPDVRYMNMITNPIHKPISKWHEPLPVRPIKVNYNSIPKRVVRKQLRNNKKIAFMSGLERFKDADHPTILTVSELEAAKLKLPLTRQLRDQEVMRIPIDDIKSKLSATPKHMLPDQPLMLRKRLFKFLPLPGPKVLVTEKDTRAPSIDGKYEPPHYYVEEVNVQHFLKTDCSLNKPI